MNSVSVNAVELFNACKAAKAAVNKRQPLAVLTHFLLAEKNDCVRVSGFDLDLGITVSIAKVFSPRTFTEAWQVALESAHEFGELPEKPRTYCPDFFSACIPCEALLAALKGAKGEVVFSQSTFDKFEVSVKIQGSEYVMQAFPSEEYPALPRVPRTHELCNSEFMLCFKEDELKSAVSAVLDSCADRKEMRTAMTGVLFEATGSHMLGRHKVTLVSTDGRRLTERQIFPTSVYLPEGTHRVIAPFGFVKEVSRLCAKKPHPDNRVHITISGNWICARFENSEVSGRIIEGTFPDYKRVIPDEKKLRSVLGSSSKDEFCKVLARLLKLPQDSTCPNLVKLDLHRKHSFFEVSSTVGKLREEIRIAKFCGTHSEEVLKIGINGKFLLEALQAMDSDQFSIHFQDDSRSMVVRSNSTIGCVVLMPIVLRKANTEEGKAA